MKNRVWPQRINNQHLHEHLLEIGKQLNHIQKQNKTIMANTDQALLDLGAIKTTIGKISAESSTMLQKITDLEAAANNADTPQSVLDAIAEVKVQAQVVDDLVPDVTT